MSSSAKMILDTAHFCSSLQFRQYALRGAVQLIFRHCKHCKKIMFIEKFGNYIFSRYKKDPVGYSPRLSVSLSASILVNWMAFYT